VNEEAGVSKPETRPEWLAANQDMLALAKMHEDEHGYSCVPEAAVRQLVREHGLDEEEALAKYGFWMEGGNRWVKPDERPTNLAIPKIFRWFTPSDGGTKE